MTRISAVALASAFVLVMVSCSSDAAEESAKVVGTPAPTAPVAPTQATEGASETIPPSDTQATDTAVTATTSNEFDPSAVGAATVTGPITGGNGKIQMGAGGFDLATVGYVEEEFFISGEASVTSRACR